MTRAILARDLKPGNIIKSWNGSLLLTLTEGMTTNQVIEFQMLVDAKIIIQTFWKDLDLVNIYDPVLIDLWQ